MTDIGIDNRPTAVDLFAGAGGLSEGLRQAGFNVVAAADHDPDACATHRLNVPDAEVVVGDLADRKRHEHVVEAGLANGRPDLVAGGPPCQAFSQIHNHDRLIADSRNRLYQEFVALVDELRPRAFVMENVPGMAQLRGGAIRTQVEEDLSLGGDYDIVAGVLDAADFGAPQTRTRLIFIGVEAGTAEPSLPIGTGLMGALTRGSRLFDAVGGPAAWLADPADARAVTAFQALSDLLVPGTAYTTAATSAYQQAIRVGSDAPQDHVPSRTREDTRRRLEAIPPGGNVYDLPEELLSRYLDGKKWGPAGNGLRLARKHFYAYRRLHPNRVCWTVNTKADFAYHYAQPRGLSVREAARIQGFPDRFHFTTASPGTPGQYRYGPRHSRYRQVGNAVPPPLGRAIGRQMIELLSARPAVVAAA
jgi:DNA (cytosine-5)-methyltransferase 1